MKKEKQQAKKQPQKESIGGLLATLERIDKKLNLFSTMNKTMPAVLLASVAVLTAVFYVRSVAYIPDTTNLLPETGEEAETTQDFVILYPEYRSSMALPDTVVGLAKSGFYSESTTVEFFIEDSNGHVTSIGIAEKGTVGGEYFVLWDAAAEGSYKLWAEITPQGETTVQSPTVSFEVK
jgi:hypothetical protein